LNEASLTLQACHTLDEAWAAAARLFGQLFRGESGALYWLDTSHRLAERVAQWGQSPPAAAAFAPEACAALKQGRTQLMSGATSRVCRHLDNPPPPASLCLPMLAHGETLGVIHLRGATPDAFTETKSQLARAAADGVTLALANLRLREVLRQQSIRDPLTGVFNRRYMEESLEREISRAARAGHSLGILMLDLDHFKRLNDTFGHDVGDEVLRRVGQFLQHHVRASDIVCRYGGEEFTLILPEATLEVTRQRAEQLRERIKTLAIQHQGQALSPLTLSAGVAMFPQHGASGAAVVQAADAALYRAKNEGRDRVVAAR
jgi:diguanylate cyclase (GGDEF)-like protein